MTYALVAEDPSDFDTIKVLIKSIANDQSVSVKGRGYAGCAEMLRKAANLLDSLDNCSRFIICYDCDRGDPADRLDAVKDIFKKLRSKGQFCALIPRQEIEAWILADIGAVSKIIPSWKPSKSFHSPETIDDPKEYLEKLSRQFQRPRYSHAIHNHKVAQHLDLVVLEKKCPSFKPLIDIVRHGKGNVKI